MRDLIESTMLYYGNDFGSSEWLGYGGGGGSSVSDVNQHLLGL